MVADDTQNRRSESAVSHQLRSLFGDRDSEGMPMPATSPPRRNGADPATPATIALAPLAPFWAMASTQMVAAQRLAIGHWRLALTTNRAVMDAWRGVLRAQQNAMLAIDRPPLGAMVANDAADVRDAVAAVHDASLDLLNAQADATEQLRKSA